MLEVLLDSLLDSLKIALVVFIVNVVLSFVEIHLARLLTKHKKLAPLYGSLFGAIPQCGISVASTDLYIKNNISIGTLIAVYLACSDEALPLLIGSMSSKSIYAIFLVLIKICVGFIVGLLVDLVIKKDLAAIDIVGEHQTADCCSVHVHSNHEKLDNHLFHPLLHTLKLFIYVLVINVIFGLLMYKFEANIMSFLEQNKYIAPLVSGLIGIIPNCASSVIITELFIENGIGFGAMVTGLLMNAGLGFMLLIKNKNYRKQALLLIGFLYLVSIFVGYIISFIIGF